MRTIAMLQVLLILIGCATPYQNKGLRGGFSEIQMDKDIFEISFVGNGYTSEERANDFVLLRSAELALEKGFDYLMVIKESSKPIRYSYTTPIERNTTENIYASGIYAQHSVRTQISGGETHEILKPRSKMRIKYFKAKDIKNKNKDELFEVKSLYDSIAKKYGIETPHGK